LLRKAGERAGAIPEGWDGEAARRLVDVLARTVSAPAASAA
jgi:hypothetical protein